MQKSTRPVQFLQRLVRQGLKAEKTETVQNLK